MDKNGQYSNWNPRIPVFYAVFAVPCDTLVRLAE